MNISGQGNWMDKLFHKKLSSYEVTPENHVWEGIAKRLDESQRRPGLFGNWWTVFLSILIMLLVTGVGAYMLYKKAYPQNPEKSQNKDLPYFENDKIDDAVYSVSDILPMSVPNVHFASMRDHTGAKKISTVQSNRRNKGNSEWERSASNDRVNLSIEEVRSNTPESENPLPTAEQNKINANELIVSSDPGFYSSQSQYFKPSPYLPLKENYLKHNDKQLKTAPLVLDGCNVFKDNKTHFFLDVYYAPEMASRSLQSKDPSLQAYVDERTSSEKPVLSYSTGLKASVVFSNGLTLRGGFSYSCNTERFDFVKETQEITTVIKDQNGNIVGTEVKKLVIMDKIYNRYNFIDIPVLLGYEKDLRDFVLSVNGGFGFNVSSSQSGKIYQDDKNKMSFYLLENNGEANQPIFRSTAGISLLGSIGLNYKYNERMMLLLEPSARYYMRSLSAPENPVNQKYLFLGLNIGLRYRLK